MEPITATAILTGLAINFASEIIVSGFKSFQGTGVDHDLELAYESALKKWSKISQLRNQKEHLSCQKLDELERYLKGDHPFYDDNTLQFIKVFENEICDKKYQSLYQHVNLELQKQQIDLLYEIRNNQNRHISPVPELQLFSKPLNYIDRTVSGYSNSTNLIELIKSEHAVALIGEGGLGKTTELDYVASILSNEGWYCGLIRLIGYADSLEKLIESQFENWQNIPDSSSVLVLLDGLDEVSSSNISKAENEIIQLTRTHKNVHFLISYRNSYSLFLSLNNEKDESKEMVRVTLDPISDEFITKYIQGYASNPASIIEQFRKQNLIEICKNPFYLINYIEIINSTGKVPDNKSDFFEQILSIRFQAEKKKGNEVTREVRKNEGKLLKKLGTLALTMQLAGKYQIANCDIQKIIDDSDLLETTRRIVLYESGITDSDNWRFEHNNFQEYLAAKILAQCSWAQMQQVLFLPNKKLKPKWYNALSFLINQLDPKSQQHKQLVEWLIENDRVAFIKLEVIHLDQTIRNQVFYSVYNYYKEKEIVFYAEFSAQELAKFCDLENNQELIDFLLDGLRSEMNIQNLYNIVELFGAIKPSDRKDIDRIALALSGYLKEEKYNKYNINSSILEAYIKWEWSNEEVLRETILGNVLIKDGSTRSNLIYYHLAVHSQFMTAEFILRCLKIRQNDTVHTFDIFSIKEAISSLSELEIINLLEELTLRDENDQSRKQKGDFISVVKSIEERASNLYPAYKEILSAVNKFVLATLEHIFRAEPAWAVRPFYEKYNLVFPLFKESFLNEKQQTEAKPFYYRFKLSGFLANFECLDWVLNEYRKGNLADDDIRKFRISMDHYNNGDGYQFLTKKMNEITDGTFFPFLPDYSEAYKKVEELFANAILDKNLFLSYIEKAFTFYSKDEISWKEFYDREDAEEHIGDVDFQICHRCLRNFMVNNKTTSKQEVLNYLGTESYWAGLQLEEHYEISKNGKLQKENIDWIINWCKGHEIEIDFKYALTEDENGYISFSRWAVYYIHFCLVTDYFSESKQVLLDLTSCLSHFSDGPRKSEKTGNNLTLYEYLQAHLLNDEINDRVIQNIKEGIETDLVLNEHLKIIENENLVDAVDSLPLYILDSRWKKWTRYKTLATYFHLNGSVENVKMLLNDLTFNDELNSDWSIIDEFIKQDKLISAKKLLEFIDNDQIDRYKLSFALIKCGQTEGLDLLYSQLENKNRSEERDEFRMEDFEGFVKSGGFKTEEVIPRLADLVIIHLQPEFKNDKWSNVIGQLFNLLAFYYNSDSQTLIFDSLSRIEKALSESENTPIYQIVYRIYQKFRIDLDFLYDSENEIETAIQKLNEIGITI
jgi:hypothetical protein